ncbi:MAG: bile acid:sodium symporter [Myxococcales bacterium]|nr:bile acid:sodium symporter [Myxococcales bacterium]
MAGQIFQLIPPIIALIMVALGMDVTVADFRRLAAHPRAAAVAIGGQLVGLPLLAFALGALLSPPAAVAASMVILAACPGGPPSNIFSYLARGNVALSIALTATTSLLGVLTLPFVVNLGLATFLHEAEPVRLEIGRSMVQLAGVSFFPIILGIFLRARFPDRVAGWQRRLRRVAFVLFAVVFPALIYQAWEPFMRYLPVAATSAICFCAGALGLGVLGGWLMRLDARDTFTVSIEIGLQNLALGTFIVINKLERPELIAFISTYTLISLPAIAAWSFGFVTLRRRRERGSAGRQQ